ncbi:MAG: hypothetical protein P8N92_08000 [Burkholderiales bacterium]|nr:hypothetical protein [Burkholderiales bacterium]
MAEGANTVTEKQFVDVEFDPFQELTTTRARGAVSFTHAGFVGVGMGVSHYRTSEQNIFKLHVSAFGDQVVDVVDDAVAFNKIMVLADQEPIAIECISYKTVGNSKWRGFAETNNRRLVTEWKGGGEVSITVESAKKIIAASGLEIRYYSNRGYQDLDNKIENEIRLMFLSVYAEAISDDPDITKFTHELEEVAQAELVKEKEAKSNFNLGVALCSILLLVIAAYIFL